ncbi:LysM domain-containing protein [Arthrobacter sp. NPDC080031]|uniref:LysM peptidoglycan-binding domain-containing protein n=1 Tax=Arthrobacter sp. NPDC080031 TaxID=3155918 RepID=UPI00344C6BA8
MGFLDGLKKNLGFDKAEPKVTGRPSEAPQKAAEASPGETVQSAGPDPSAEAGALAAPGAAVSDAGAPAAPGAAVSDAGAPAASARQVTEVVVEADDTLSGIAMQFGVDLDALIAANADNVPNPDHIYPGQVLRLP